MWLVEEAAKGGNRVELWDNGVLTEAQEGPG